MGIKLVVTLLNLKSTTKNKREHKKERENNRMIVPYLLIAR